jgi:general secretion pathway protein G
MFFSTRGKRGSRRSAPDGGPPAPFSPLPFSFPARASAGGWTLIELVITITVLTVLTLSVVPIVRNSVRRQKEVRLRDSLREMRAAIDEFRRDTVGMQCGPLGATGPGGGAPVSPGQPPQPGQPPVPPQPGQPGQSYIDPRSKVVIADCTIFGVDNPDRYPPSLEMLVEGVDVLPRGQNAAQQLGSVDTSRGGATGNSPALATKKKIYLRELPVDPITGAQDWCLRSSYQTPDGGCESAPENVFDVRSRSGATALNGEKYSDW